MTMPPRGPEHAQHDRDEAIVHASDIIAILNAVVDITALREAFYGQFAEDVELGIRATDHLRTYFWEDASPGMLLYEESLRAGAPLTATAERNWQMNSCAPPE
jgi:hypothetical protein